MGVLLHIMAGITIIALCCLIFIFGRIFELTIQIHEIDEELKESVNEIKELVGEDK